MTTIRILMVALMLLCCCCCCSVAKLCLIFLWPHGIVTRQAPLFVGFPRQECWGGLPCPPPGDLPDPGIQPCLQNWQMDSLPLSHEGSPWGTSKKGSIQSPRMMPQGHLYTGRWRRCALTRCGPLSSIRWCSKWSRTRTKSGSWEFMVLSPSLPPSPWFCPFPFLFKIIWSSFRSLVLSLHFIWSLFHVTPGLGFCYYHPVLALLNMGMIILSFLLLSWPSLKIQAWTHLVAQLLSATAGWIPCSNEPLELWLEGPSGQIYLFLLLPRKNCV